MEYAPVVNGMSLEYTLTRIPLDSEKSLSDFTVMDMGHDDEYACMTHPISTITFFYRF